MTTLHVVAAGGVLTAAATYTENAAPTANDDIVCDGTAGNVSLTSSNLSCHSLDFTGYTGTFSCSTTRTITLGGAGTLTTAAVLKLGSGMTFSLTGTFTWTLDNRSGGITITG